MQQVVTTSSAASAFERAERAALTVGPQLTRYALVVLLLLFGALKWTPDEARAIEPFISHSPLWSWLYPLLGTQGTSIFFGVFEVAAGFAIALRPWLPLVSAYGSGFGIVMFATTLSFLATTPGLLASPGSGFVMKDLVLLGASVWCTGEALAAYRTRRAQRRAP